MKYIIRCSTQFSWAIGLLLAGYVVASAGVAYASHAGEEDFIPGPLPDELFITEPTEVPPVGEAISVTGFSSRPGAAYTVYLDFGGFTFNGNWGGDSSQTPGTTPAYTVDSDATTFTTTENANIKNIWSRVAEKYSPFNVNVTTIDPAPAGTDTSRQLYYDQHSRLMHTVIGGTGGWSGGGGVSYIGVTPNTYTGSGTSNGKHTNWVFAAQSPSNLQFVAEASAHENGHGFDLYHESDYSGTTLVNEYSSGSGGRAPIMGNSYSATRGLWKIGTAHVNSSGPTNQNDVAKIISSNSGLPPFINDGIGHTLGTATPLPMSGLNVDFNSAKGVIVPSANNPPSTTGASNYLADYWSFSTGTGLISLSVIPGRESITPGTADPGAMLDASLEILDTSGSVLFSSITTSLSQTLTVSILRGDYIARVSSAADPTATSFFDIGSYFLKGTLINVPEPSTMALLMLTASWLGFSRRKRYD